MSRKLLLSIAMLAVGAGLLVAAGFASPASSGTDKAKAGVATGGTLRLSKSTDVDYVDPSLAYFTDTFGMIFFATCAKLYNYPDKTGAAGTQIQPEVANGFPKVSKDGKTVTITLKNTYRFHDGSRVTAANYAEMINRNANPKMQSPATSYMHEIVGVDAVLDNKAQRVSGVIAKGNTLTLKLTQPLPDLVARLTMSFFCPIKVGTPIEPDGINNPPGSGPYYVAERTVNRQLVLKENPFYKGPRPHNYDQIIWTIGPSLEACRLNVEQNNTDYCVDGIPPTAYKEVADKYGINRKNGQFFFNTILGTSYFALNHDRPAIKNVNFKRAINIAIDRPALLRAGGFLGGVRTDQILPPALTKNVNVFPLGGVTQARIDQAKKLAGSANKLVLYTANRGARVVRAQVFQFNMKQIGVDVDVRQFARAVQHEKCATRGEDFDVCDEGWLIDYADAVTFFDPLLNGNNIQATGNANESYYNNKKFNAEIEAIAKLSGQERFNRWAALDGKMMKEDPPWAPFINLTNRDFISKSVGCYQFHPVMQINLAALCRK